MQITIAGCGHIGTLLARQLAGKNLPVRGIVRSESGLAACRTAYVPCEIIDLDDPAAPLDLTGNRVIYLVPPPRSGREDTRIANFLRAIATHPPEKFVLISTTGVYGDCAGGWVDETTPLNPQTDRARRRADAEQRTRQFCRMQEIPLVILRVPGIYGPGRVPLERIRSGAPIVREQDSPFTNRIHADDLVNICQSALTDTGITGIYNASDGNPGTMYEYFTGVAKTLNLPEPPAISLQEAQQRLSAGMLSYLSESRRIDNRKLLNDFAIELRYPDLETGLGSLQ